MTEGRDREILVSAIDAWGVDAQLEMIIEECLELALSLQHLKRDRGDKSEKLAAVRDELADAAIMIQQGMIMFGENEVKERMRLKLLRLADRIEGKNKTCGL